jgi:SSS family solute:Na+ symporter
MAFPPSAARPDFKNLMEFVQMVFSIFGVPFFVVFLVGIFTRWATSSGAIAGLLCGTLVAGTYHLLVATGELVFVSLMSASFHAAVYAFCASLAGIALLSRKTQRLRAEELELLVYRPARENGPRRATIRWWALACVLLGLCAFLNYLWR